MPPRCSCLLQRNEQRCSRRQEGRRRQWCYAVLLEPQDGCRRIQLLPPRQRSSLLLLLQLRQLRHQLWPLLLHLDLHRACIKATTRCCACSKAVG